MAYVHLEDIGITGIAVAVPKNVINNRDLAEKFGEKHINKFIRTTDEDHEKQAAILKAEAQKERMTKEAEGQAEAVLKVQKANAEGIRMIREAGADQAVLTLKSLEAFGKAADGKATKIIIPSEIQGLAGLASSLKEIVVEDKKTEE